MNVQCNSGTSDKTKARTRKRPKDTGTQESVLSSPPMSLSGTKFC